MWRDRDLVPDRKNERTFRQIALLSLIGVGSAALLRLLLQNIWFFPLLIDNNFTQPAFENGERIYINRSIKPDSIKKGDYLLVEHPHNPEYRLFRQVVALSGDRLRIEDGKTYLNGNYINSNYEKNLSRVMGDNPGELPAEIFPLLNAPEVTVPPGGLYLLADNPGGAIDSRLLGPVPSSKVVGRAESFLTIVITPPLNFFNYLISLFK